MGDDCTWDPPPLAGPVPNDVAEEIGTLKRRVALLEKRLESVSQKQDEQSTVLQQAKSRNGSEAALSFSPARTSPMVNSYQAPVHSLPRHQPQQQLQHLSPQEQVFGQNPPSLRPSPATPHLNLPQEGQSSGSLTLAQVDHMRSETEHAAQALEDLALPVGSRREQPAAEHPKSTDTEDGADSVNLRSGALTTILLGPAQNTPADLIQSLPHPEVLDVLVDWYFESDLCWLYQVLHRGAFQDEIKELKALRARSHRNLARVDPAFLSILYVLLAWSGSVIGPVAARKVRQHLSFEDLRSMPDAWLSKMEDCFKAAAWSERPQVRIAQALCLRLAYSRTPPHGIFLGLETNSFFILLGAAKGICQLLGLHKLGRNPMIMPRCNDPAWPAQPCSFKREMAKRIWWFVCTEDHLFSVRLGMGSIPMNSYDTEYPLDVDDEDIGLNVLVEPRPRDFLSDVSFARMKIGISMHTAKQWYTHPEGEVDYDMILSIGEDMQRELSRYEHYRADSNSKRRPYHRSLLLLVQQNRVLRLHRPYFMKGWSDSRFEPSTRDALQAAKDICTGLDVLHVDDGNLSHAFFVFAYGLSAVFVLFVTVLRLEKRHSAPTEESKELRRLIGLARSFYARSAQDESSQSIKELCLQACEVIDQLAGGRSTLSLSRNTGSAVAAIFLKIASLVHPPEAAGGTSNEANDSTTATKSSELGLLGVGAGNSADGLSDTLAALSHLFTSTPNQYMHHMLGTEFDTRGGPQTVAGATMFSGQGFDDTLSTNQFSSLHAPQQDLGLSASASHNMAGSGAGMDANTHQNAVLGAGMMATTESGILFDERTRSFLASFAPTVATSHDAHVTGDGSTSVGQTPASMNEHGAVGQQRYQWDLSQLVNW
ncbi:hypothetical protein OIV83_004473 [Microbotryomycetes sp. JL201]|nr:hypothetical protein OIV83_004473 [Microbotryomycetes sp. JL201]